MCHLTGYHRTLPEFKLSLLLTTTVSTNVIGRRSTLLRVLFLLTRLSLSTSSACVELTDNRWSSKLSHTQDLPTQGISPHVIDTTGLRNLRYASFGGKYVPPLGGSQPNHNRDCRLSYLQGPYKR